MIGNNVTVIDDSIVPAGTYIPENTIYGGKPAKFMKLAADSHELEHQTNVVLFYENVYASVTDYLKWKRRSQAQSDSTSSSKKETPAPVVA